MKREKALARAAAAALAVLAVVACAPATRTADEIADATRSLRALVPAIEAGLALAVPVEPTARAISPNTDLKTTGVDNPWEYADKTPADVYAAVIAVTAQAAGSTVRLPASGYYENTKGDQLYFRLTPEPTLGATYYRIVLYTYPAVDLAVAYTVEEYIVNSAGTESWAWGNLDLSKTRDRWVSLTTAYLDGTTGTRRLVWSSGTSGTYFEAFVVGEPDPTSVPTFDGYRYADSATAPAPVSASYNFSSHVTERVTGKAAVSEAIQYYTETSGTVHSGLTYVYVDKKQKKLLDTAIVTRMEEDTVAGTKKIRSVGEVGIEQYYYVDKVDITTTDGITTYESSHDIYDGAVPRRPNKDAKEYVALTLTEDGVDAHTFTGSLEQTDGTAKVTRPVRLARDARNNELKLTVMSGTTGARAVSDDLVVGLSQQDLSTVTIPLDDVNGTFVGYYEAGSLYGTVTTGDQVFQVAVAVEGILVDEELYPY